VEHQHERERHDTGAQRKSRRCEHEDRQQRGVFVRTRLDEDEGAGHAGEPQQSGAQPRDGNTRGSGRREADRGYAYATQHTRPYGQTTDDGRQRTDKILLSSCPAKAGHPVNTDGTLSQRPVATGSPAFAGDDDWWLLLYPFSVVRPLSSDSVRILGLGERER